MTSMLRRATGAVIIGCAGVSLGVGGAIVTVARTPSLCADAAYTSHVTLVVEHGSGHVIGLCIGFDGSSITGEEILRASGVEFATSTYGSLGDAVCQIDYEPSSYPPGCWTSSSPYWAMFVSRGGGGWSGADRGVSSEAFANGDAEGFRYDAQTGSPATPSPPSGICSAALSGGSSSSSGGDGSSGTSPRGAGSGSPTASPVHGATSSAPSATSAASAPSNPTPGVVGGASHSAGSVSGIAATGQRQSTGSISIGFALAAAAGGALLGLVLVRLLIRRRRA
ncbi:MAG: hypothetical protein JOY80_07650 [Candidatus Dormibacteraeota bacterium]|nr:hypothetical protein [Candidatus Dormibacteraeota bacterium]